MWAEYQNTQPVHELCENCWIGYCKGVAPRQPQTKPVVANMLKTNPASLNRVQKWTRHLDNRGAVSPAIGGTNIPNSVSRKVTVGMEWMEERKIHPIAKLKNKHPDVDWENPPCSVCTVNDASKQPQKVVLTDMPGSEPVLRVYSKTEVTMDEHFLTPDTMLRVGQGDEFFRQQLAIMVQMVPFSKCDSESVLQEKLRQSCRKPPSGMIFGEASPADMEVDPLLAPEQATNSASRAAACEFEQLGSSTAGSSTAGSSMAVDGGGGSAVSPADASSTRRLRANLSNPEPPKTPAKKARGCSSDTAGHTAREEGKGTKDMAEAEGKAKPRGRGRGRGKGQRSATANDGSPGKLTKATAVPLTLENVLGGKVMQPRVQLGWRKAERPKSHKCDVHSEQKELLQLAAALTFLPEELDQQTAEEISANALCVEEKLVRSCWPWYTWKSLLHRRLQNTLAAQEWTFFLNSLWAWGSEASPDDSLNVLEPTLRSIIAVLGSAVSPADDLPDAEGRAKFVRDWLVKDALADLMSKNQQGTTGILALHDLVKDMPQPTQKATTLEQAIFDEATGAVAAVAGLVQEGPADVNQVSALREMMSENAESESAKSLSSLFETRHWQERVQSFWEFAVEEVMIGPQMSQVIAGLESSNSETVGEMWHIAMNSYTQWIAKQRPGKTAALSRALTLWCRKTAESLCCGEASDEWLTLAEQVRSRSKWVEENCDSKIGDVLAKLNDIYNCNHGKIQVSAVIGLMSQWSQQDHGGADSPAVTADEGQDTIQGILAKLDACKGLVFPVQDVPVVVQFLQKLASNIDSDQHARLGLMVTQMLPVLDTSSREAHTDSSAWEHAICGWKLAALAHSGAVSPAVESELSSLASAWEKGNREHADLVQHTQLQAAVNTAITSGLDVFKSLVVERKKSMQDAVSKLEQCAGGKEDKGSWKGNLKDDSTWDDVQREAGYFLERKPEQGPLQKHLDKVFAELSSARTQLEAAAGGLKVTRRLRAIATAFCCFAGSADSLAGFCCWAVQIRMLPLPAEQPLLTVGLDSRSGAPPVGR